MARFLCIWGLGFLSLWVVSCGQPAGTEANVGAGGGSERSFQVKGVVREIPPARQTLVIRHEAIPGYMPRMTMELTLANTNEAAELVVGDEIEFRLVARAEDHFIDQIRRLGTRSPVEAAAGSAVKPEGTDEELKPGDMLPDFGMLMENGTAARFSNHRGTAVAFTFFFTRCPLPDFCPRMNKNLADARRILLGSTEAPTNWMLLSLSFDAEFDRPAVLALHAKTYRGEQADRWLFGAVEAKDLAVLAPRLDLKITREAGSYSHNLRTVVVDAGGRIFRQFDGNQWTPGELADALRGAASGPQ
ncbi:MAG: copper-binding protein [Verrucomicrobiales bacterium]|nr:copper-binding protein [Verrucomicrobiales bacterium]